MKNNKKNLTAILSFLLFAILIFYVGCINSPKKEATLRLGWQPPWANQGQIVEILKNTDVLSRNGVKVDFKPFSYGGPMTEAALAGELDVFFSGDQPAITLISKEPKWRIIARMVNYRSAIIIPSKSNLKTLEELRGKKIATAFGSTTHRDLVRILKSAGFEIGKDVTLVNVDQAEHAAIISRGGTDNWSGIDAIATYDPTIAISVFENKAQILQEWVSPAVVVASEDAIQNRPNDLKNFLKAYIESYAIYGNDPEHYNSLYSQESRLKLNNQVFQNMAQVESNMKVKDINSVDIYIDYLLRKTYQTNADVAFSLGIIKKQININQNIDLHILDEATKELKENK